MVSGITLTGQFAGPGSRLPATSGDGGENIGPPGVIGIRPVSNFVEIAETALAQAAGHIHLADVDTGGGQHLVPVFEFVVSDQQEAVLLVAHLFNGFEGFVAVDSGEHGQMQTPVTGS